MDGRYRVEEKLAAGGMGVVYRGERLGLAKKVAIKFLHSSSARVAERLERFDREAAAMSRLTHPNLVSVIDFGSFDGVPYLIMEYHAGVSLDELLAEGKLEPARAVAIAHQILAGLASAHEANVVHRDLKPANILLVGGPGEEFVKIFDFGVAKLLDTGSAPSELSVVAQRVLGTPEYMAPEQARCEEVDERTDLYAVGIILYEMVTGKRPFSGGGNLQVLRMQVEDRVPDPAQLAPAISRELDAAIMRALEKDPAERWQSAAEFATALANLPEGSGVVSLRAQTPTSDSGEEEADAPPVRRTGRRRAKWIAAVALLLACAGAGVVLAASAGLVEIPGLSGLLGSGAAPAPDAAAASPVPPPPPPDAAPPAPPGAYDMMAPPDASVACVVESADAAVACVAEPDAATFCVREHPAASDAGPQETMAVTWDAGPDALDDAGPQETAPAARDAAPDASVHRHRHHSGRRSKRH